MAAENQDDLSGRSTLLGAVGALGIVVELTLDMEPESVVRWAEQRVIAFGSRDQAVAFAHEALRFQADLIEKARGVEGLAVDFSGTHSQPDDPGFGISPALIFGSEAMATMVREQKKQVDPGNRFRFHPFAKFL